MRNVFATILVCLPLTALAGSGLPKAGSFDGVRDHLSAVETKSNAIGNKTDAACGGGNVPFKRTVEAAEAIMTPVGGLVDKLGGTKKDLKKINPNSFPGPTWNPQRHDRLTQAVVGARGAAKDLRSMAKLVIGAGKVIGGKPGDEEVMGLLEPITHRNCKRNDSGEPVCPEAQEAIQADFCAASTAVGTTTPKRDGAW